MTDLAEVRPTIELVKQTVTVTEVAEMLGLEPDRHDKITSPWNPDERTPSCHLYEDHFWDFSTGRGGDVIDLVQAIYPELTTMSAVYQIWSKALRAGKEPGDVERQPVRQIKDFSEELEGYATGGHPFFDELGPPANCRYDYDSYGGVDLLIPHADQDGVYGVKVRHLNGRKDAWPGSQFTKRLYDPLGWRPVDRDPGAVCIITEGETDCWALQAALPFDEVFALPSGAQSWKDSWLEDLKPFERIWIATDNDTTGVDARHKLLARIGERARTFEVPALAKDVREALSMFPDWDPAAQLVRD